MESAMHTPDITIHINQELDQERRQELELSMRRINGVIAPRFNLPHLLVVLYNAERTSASALLDAVRGSGYQAQLVGL
jgi:hypothetical protein